jgi:hypothetical protein
MMIDHNKGKCMKKKTVTKKKTAVTKRTPAQMLEYSMQAQIKKMGPEAYLKMIDKRKKKQFKVDGDVLFKIAGLVIGLLGGAAMAAPSSKMRHDAQVGEKFKSNWK